MRMRNFVRLVVAFAILIAGALAARSFRQPAGATGRAAPERGADPATSSGAAARPDISVAAPSAVLQPPFGGGDGWAELSSAPIGAGTPDPARAWEIAPPPDFDGVHPGFPADGDEVESLDTRQPLVSVEPRRESAPAPAIAAEFKYHVVRAGETLQSIARLYYGRPEHYLELYRANREVLSSPLALPVGARLKVPNLDRP
jgi:hypothetical protein